MYNESPDVSIIIPAYNAEKFIEISVQSALNQTFKNIQIVIVNDGSVDNTKMILKKYQKYKSIVIINEENKGVSAARNIAIMNAIGKYLFFMDADDYINNNIIELMFEFAEKNNLDLVSCNYIEHGSKASKKSNYPQFIASTQSEIGKHYFDVYPKTVWAKMFRSDIIKNNNICFQENMALGEDKYFTCSYMMHVKRIGNISDKGYHWVNINPYSLSKCYCQNMEFILNEQWDLWKKVIEKYPEADIQYHVNRMSYGIHLTAAYMNNLFLKHSPFNFRKKILLINDFLEKYSFLIELKKEYQKPKKKSEKILYKVIMTKKGLIIGIFFYTKQCIKGIQFISILIKRYLSGIVKTRYRK